ncbi:MAG: glutamine-synthetase adenylyltransferase, partial [Bryobacteraceae bacterium]
MPERIGALIEVLLQSIPDPKQARRYLTRFRQESGAAFERLANSPTALRYMITTFSYSRFLAEEVLRYPNWLTEVAESGDLHRVLSAEELEERLRKSAPSPAPLDLARFRRRQILRILLRDVLGIATLAEVAEELSNLSDAMLEVSYRSIRDRLAERHGIPQREGNECGFAVLSLGKLGGKELNYSSDIDLMFVYGGEGQTGGPEPISNKEFYKKVSNQYTELLSTHTTEGFCYRVDLRLRPDGRLGEVCLSLDGARRYYETRARDWELQMLIKARISAGDRDVGRALLDFVEPKIYSTTLDFRAVESVSETRQRIGEKLSAR